MLIPLYFWPPMHAGKAAPAARESPEAKRWETKVWLACTEMVRPKEAQVRHQQPLRCLCNRHVQRVHSILISSTPNPFLLVFPVLVNGHYSCSQKPWVLDSSLLHSTFNLSANPIISTSKYSPKPAPSQPLTALFLAQTTTLSCLDYSDRLPADLSFSASDPLQPIFNRAARVILLSISQVASFLCPLQGLWFPL